MICPEIYTTSFEIYLLKFVSISAFKNTEYRHSTEDFDKCFKEEAGLVYCHDIPKLFGLFKYPHIPSQWRIFLDSSKSALKVVLLHNGNKQPSVPIAYSKTMKETYDDMKIVLEKIRYQQYKWKICADLKMVAILMGIQAGNVKYGCFLCLWDSRDREQHYKRDFWPPREKLSAEEQLKRMRGVQSTQMQGPDLLEQTHNILKENLIDANDVILPPLHIKLGLMSQFIKTLVTKKKKKTEKGQQAKRKRKEEEEDEEEEENEPMKRIHEMFPKLTMDKINAGVFVGPDILKILKDRPFFETLSDQHKEALMALKDLTGNFLGNKRASNYVDLVQNFLQKFEAINALMSIKMHFLKCHLNEFAENLGAYSDEHGERFHQDIKAMEKRYNGKSYTNMLGDHCWRLIREAPDTKWSRLSLNQTYFEIED